MYYIYYLTEITKLQEVRREKTKGQTSLVQSLVPTMACSTERQRRQLRLKKKMSLNIEDVKPALLTLDT